MLAVHGSTIRLYLHVLAASVWVGGQIVLAGLVPALRKAGDDVPRAAARAFNKVAWPAFTLAWFTGIWNLMAVEPTWTGAYGATLMVKLLVVVASGVSAFAHATTANRRALAVFGALTGLTALGALFLGVQLHG